jgi:hypothetical protein
MTPMQNIRDQSNIGGLSTINTPGLPVGTTGSPLDMMMNELDIENHEGSSPEIIGAARNNRRDRALA